MHALMLVEQERSVQEQARLEHEEADRKDMEPRAQLMRRHTVVQIKNLKQREDLNQQLGYFMGVQGDRYVIQLTGSHKEVALKEDNFENWITDRGAFVDNGHKKTDRTSCHTSEVADSDFSEGDGRRYDAPAPASTSKSPHSSNPVSGRKSTPSADHDVPVMVSCNEKCDSQQCRKPVATVYISQQFVGHFIGPKGSNVQRIKQVSGAKWIHLDRAKAEVGYVPIRIEGQPECVERVVEMAESNSEIFLKSNGTSVILNKPLSASRDHSSPLSLPSNSVSSVPTHRHPPAAARKEHPPHAPVLATANVAAAFTSKPTPPSPHSKPSTNPVVPENRGLPKPTTRSTTAPGSLPLTSTSSPTRILLSNELPHLRALTERMSFCLSAKASNVLQGVSQVFLRMAAIRGHCRPKGSGRSHRGRRLSFGNAGPRSQGLQEGWIQTCCGCGFGSIYHIACSIRRPARGFPYSAPYSTPSPLKSR